MAKKVLYVVTKSNFGGAQRYVYDLARSLPTREFDVAVAFGLAPGGKPGRLAKLLAEKNIETLYIPQLGRDISIVNDWKVFRMLFRLFKTQKPDVVHLNSSKAGSLGALAARLAGVPRIIFTSHGLPYDEKRTLISRFMIQIATWLTIALTHRTVMISSDTFARTRRLPLLYRKVVLVYNGIETPEFESPHDARKALLTIDPTLPEKGRLVGTIAELHPNKDLILAIDAIALTDDMHFAILGDGELRVSLEAYAREKGVSDRVHFLGYISDAGKYLRAFDVFLLTSFKEGLPYVLLEAGAAHVPIIAVDIPGVRDVVLPDFTGILPPRDPEKIADAIGRVLDDDSLRRSLVEQMATRIQKTFSLPQMLEKTAALY